MAACLKAATQLSALRVRTEKSKYIKIFPINELKEIEVPVLIFCIIQFEFVLVIRTCVHEI